MTCPFDITTATNSVRLDAKRQGEAAFTVFNRSGRPVRGRAQLAPKDPRAAAWLKLAGAVERNFATAGTEQYTIQIDVPAAAPAGNYAFQLDMVGVENPDEEYCAGPAVTFEVPVLRPEKPFPWKLIAALVVALVVIGIAAYFLWPRTTAVPTLTGLTAADAEATLVAGGLVRGQLLKGEGGEVETGHVFASTPGPGTPVALNSTVDLVVAAATPTPTPTPIPPPDTPTPTPTLDLAATATAEAQAAATATAAALAAAIDKYVGSWELSGDGSLYITTFTITRNDQTVTIAITGEATISSNGGVAASSTCLSACTWGHASLTYTGDPLQFNLNSGGGETQRLTVVAVEPGRLTTIYRVPNMPDMTASFIRAPWVVPLGPLAAPSDGVFQLQP